MWQDLSISAILFPYVVFFLIFYLNGVIKSQKFNTLDQVGLERAAYDFHPSGSQAGGLWFIKKKKLNNQASFECLSLTLSFSKYIRLSLLCFWFFTMQPLPYTSFSLTLSSLSVCLSLISLSLPLNHHCP